MDRLAIRHSIKLALENIGYVCTENDFYQLQVNDVLPDSIAFIMFILELEDILKIEIPDEYLTAENVTSWAAIINLIQYILKSKK